MTEDDRVSEVIGLVFIKGHFQELQCEVSCASEIVKLRKQRRKPRSDESSFNRLCNVSTRYSRLLSIALALTALASPPAGPLRRRDANAIDVQQDGQQKRAEHQKMTGANHSGSKALMDFVEIRNFD